MFISVQKTLFNLHSVVSFSRKDARFLNEQNSTIIKFVDGTSKEIKFETDKGYELFCRSIITFLATKNELYSIDSHFSRPVDRENQKEIPF